jgi:hypothetical protein
MSSKPPLDIYKYHFFGICSGCNEKKILSVVVDCVTAYCLPCVQKMRRKDGEEKKCIEKMSR